MLRAHTLIRHPAIAQAMTRIAQDHEEMLRPIPGGWCIDAPYGRLEAQDSPGALAVAATAPDDVGLSYLRLILAEHLAQYMPDPPEILWQGDGAAMVRPPFLHEARVLSSRPLSLSLHRLRLATAGAAALASDSAFHIRLLVPPPGRAPRWPHLAPSGRMVWPEGEDRLLVRVYTIRRADPAAGWVEVDFVTHGGAPGTAAGWATACRPGDPVALLGPGGGGVPPGAGPLLLAGDETALPAIARLLDTLPASRPATAFVEVEDPRHEIPLPRPVHWLHRHGAAPGSCLAPALAAHGPTPGFLWAAAEFRAFRAIRQLARETWALPRDRQLITAYWREGRDGAARHDD